MSWKEYQMDTGTVADYLVWGGLTHPCILQNKDDSILGVIAYEPYPVADSQMVVLPEFRNGWCLWIEQQHTPERDQYFLVVCWNPFLGRNGSVINSLEKKSFEWNKVKNSFYQVLQNIGQAIGKVTKCRILEYQEILDFLSFTLSVRSDRCVEMPEVPLYLDALLSQDIEIDFSGNHLLIEGQKLCVISLPAMAEDDQMQKIRYELREVNYRHVQRLMLLSKKRSVKEERWYTSRWCSGRQSIRDMITEGLSKSLNGYHMDVLCIPFGPEVYKENKEYLKHFLNMLQLPYIMESYNLKEIWWGSLPGMFRANVVPPMLGFDSLDELLVHTERIIKKEESANVQDESVPAQENTTS